MSEGGFAHEQDPAITYIGPAEAAERLHVSPSGLRRLAPIYESVYGKLNRTGAGKEEKQPRLWTTEAVERLTTARALVEADKHNTVKKYPTIHKALKAMWDGVADEVTLEVSNTPHTASDPAIHEALRVLLNEVKALRDEVAELKSERRLERPQETESVVTQQVNPLDTPTTPEVTHGTTHDASPTYGILVRLAMRLEGFTRRFRS